MTSISEVSLAPMSSSAESAGVDDPFGPTFSSWKPVEAPAPTRPSPTPLVVLAVLTGLGAMVLGGIAVVAATRSTDGGRAASLVRGFERAPAGLPHQAWVVRPSGKPVRAARFEGTERAVFLSAPVGRSDSVVVASDRAAALRPKSARVVAARG